MRGSTPSTPPIASRRCSALSSEGLPNTAILAPELADKPSRRPPAKQCEVRELSLGAAGIQCILTPPRAPNANAFAERFVRSIKSECLDRLILIGEDSLQRALREYSAYYNRERNHQGIGNQLIAPRAEDLAGTGAVQRRGRLGGMLNFYRRKAG